jgi:hypothetical protein
MLYNFMSGEHALKNIAFKRLKISRIAELNDPYELTTIASENPELIAAMERTKADLNRDKGVLCFSQMWSDPVMWSHYADSHRGMALGFVRNGEAPAPVTYSPDLLAEDWFLGIIGLPDGPEKEAGVLKWLTSKYEVWRYEQESRVFVDLDEPDAIETGLFFSDFGPETIDLREVIIGVRCGTTVAQIQGLLAAQGYTNVKVIQARLSSTRYEVIEAR